MIRTSFGIYRLEFEIYPPCTNSFLRLLIYYFIQETVHHLYFVYAVCCPAYTLYIYHVNVQKARNYGNYFGDPDQMNLA